MDKGYKIREYHVNMLNAARQMDLQIELIEM